MRCIPRVLLPPCAWLGLLSGIGSTLEAQQYPACVLQFGVWNQARHVPGTVQAECPGGIPLGLGATGASTPISAGGSMGTSSRAGDMPR